MLFVLVELSGVYCTIAGGQYSAPIAHIILPRAFITILFACEYFALTMTFVGLPLPHIKIFVIVIAVALAFSEVLTPFTMVLVVRTLLLV